MREAGGVSALTVGSLFSGIGGIDLGLERAGHRTLWFCEVDPFCRRVLRKHWPHVPIYEDIRELRGADIVRPDLLAGGFPCQDLSHAGRRAGIDGERSGLWAEFHRLVREIRPRYVLVENVPGLLNRGMERVLGDLAGIGYDAEWQSLPAAAFGAPHLRWRVFLLAYPQCAARREEPEGDLPHGDDAGWQEAAGGSRVCRSTGRTASLANSQEQPIGTGLCPNPAAGFGRGRSGHGGSAGDVADTEGIGGELRSSCRGRPGRPSGGSDTVALGVGQRDRLEGFLAAGSTAGATIGGSGDWWAVEPNVGRVAYGVPSRVDRLRALGNAVVPQCAEWIGERLMEAVR